MSTQPYTHRFKMFAVACLHEAGFPDRRGALAEVAHQLDLPPTTLKYWFQNPSQPIRRRQPTYPTSAVNAIKSTISLPSAALSSTFDAQEHENSTTIGESVTTIAPTELNLPDLIAFYTAELAHIRAVLHNNRETATYKDLLTAHRLLTTDIETLKARLQYEQHNSEDLTERLLKAMEQFAPAPPEDDSATTFFETDDEPSPNSEDAQIF